MHILSQEFLSILDGTADLPTPSPHAPPQSQFDGLPPAHFPIPIINLHPALPGAFDGANAIGRAHEAAARGEIKNTGVMVHKVVKEVDAGEPLLVREVECIPGETLEQLETRMHEVSANRS
jgi:phosphoribosylglycinamide formyltransferase